MTENRIEAYAEAIAMIAEAEDQQDRVGDELYRIARAFESSSELRDALTNPALPSDRKLGIVTDLVGERASTLSMSLVNFVVGAGRARDLPGVADALAERLAETRDHVVGEVRSVEELDAETVARLEDALSRATGKRVEARVVIDPTIIGGVVARVGDIVIDGSVKGRLDSLRDSMQVRS